MAVDSNGGKLYEAKGVCEDASVPEPSDSWLARPGLGDRQQAESNNKPRAERESSARVQSGGLAIERRERERQRERERERESDSMKAGQWLSELSEK